jgi:hypothetical protein
MYSKNLLISLFTSIVVLVMLLTLTELVLYLIKKPIPRVESVYSYVQFNIDYGLEFKPNHVYNEYDSGGKVNSHGFYSPEIVEEKKFKRLAFIGDSYTIGPGLNQEENYPHQVYKKLKEKDPELEYLVSAIGGLSPFQNKFIYKEKIMKFKPDILIYQLYDNDIGDDYIFSLSPYYARMQVWSHVPPLLRKSMLVQQFMIIAADWRTREYEKKYNSTQKIILDNPKKIWEEYTKPSLDEMLEMSRQQGAKFVLLYLPSGYSFIEYNSDKPAPEGYILEGLTRKWAVENKVPYVSMYEEFKTVDTEELNELYLPEEKGYHLNKVGTDLVFNELNKIISSMNF